jgi:hypothetical protein
MKTLEYYVTSSEPDKGSYRVVVSDRGIIKAEWWEDGPVEIVPLDLDNAVWQRGSD